MPERYHYPAEQWSAAKCARMVKRITKDALGTRAPAGHVWDSEIGVSRDFNGGTVIGGQWYRGVIYPLPALASGYSWVRSSLGLRIIHA